MSVKKNYLKIIVSAQYTVFVLTDIFSFLNQSFTLPSSTIDTIANKMPGPRRRKRNNNRAVQSNRKKGRRPRLSTKVPEAPEVPEVEASVPPELIPEPP